MAAARSRQDVARLLRAHELPGPVDETFVAVLAAQARDAAGTAVAAPPRRALKLAGAAVAVVASTMGVAVAANQGLFVPPDPQHSPPATTTTDVPEPGPVDADDAAEERAEDHVARPDASEAPAPREHRADAPDADDDTSAVETEDVAPEQSGPAKPDGDRTKGGTGGEDGPGEDPADDTAGDDETDDGADDSSDDGADESESPESDESETEGPEADEPESDDGADSSETSDPEPDEATESASVNESEDAVSG